MSHIFISYSRVDRNAIEPILNELEANDLQYWLDDSDILPTMEFNAEILNGLNKCPWFLIAMTPQSAASEYVKDELHWALTNRNGRIIPVMLEVCDPASFHLRLLRIQYVDFTGNPKDRTGLLEQTLIAVQRASTEQSLTLENQPLSAELELVSLLLTFISRHHQKHLRNLLQSNEKTSLRYRGGRPVRGELRDLCNWGLLERRPNVRIGDFADDNQQFVLGDLVKLTSLGERLARHVR